MGARALLVLAFVTAPSLVRALTLAQAGPVRSTIELPFYLSETTQVWAEAKDVRLKDLGPNGAPEAFLDGEYLGALRGPVWRGSRAVELGPGAHRFLLRKAASLDAEDFVAGQVFVYANALSKAAKTVSGANPKALSPVAAAGGCAWRQRRDWPAALKNGLTLSVVGGREIGSGELVRLKPGDAWSCGLKVTAPGGRSPALMAGVDVPEGKPVRWVFSLDPDPPKKVDAVGYRPGDWERLQVKLCDGLLSLRFASAPAIKVPWTRDEAPIEIAAQAVEISLRPLP